MSIDQYTHSLPTRVILQSITHGQKFFAKLGAVHGYFQLALDEELSYLTTFLLPQGCFRYLWAPMGLNASSDEWCRHSDVVIEGLEWCMKIVDNIVIWATTTNEMWERIYIVLEKCKVHNITISRKKLEIVEEIEFAGHVVSHRSIQPNPAKYRAIRDFPQPKNIKELRSCMGLPNQLSSFLPDLQQCTVNMRKLMSPKNELIWTPVQTAGFKKSKNILLSTKMVQLFSRTPPTSMA